MKCDRCSKSFDGLDTHFQLYDLDNEDDGTVRREAARIMEAW